jgi:DNA polymerase III delta prime subunit
MLERSSAEVFHDQFLCAHVDVSACNFVLTANSLSSLSAPLLSRCDIYHLRAPERDQYPAIIDSVRREFAAELGVDERFLVLDGHDYDFLSSTPEIRDLRTLASVTRRVLEHRAIQSREQGALH